MNRLPDNVKSYLNKYSNPKWELVWNNNPAINNVIVIPTLAEFDNIKILLNSLIENYPENFHDTLAIFVINNTDSENSEFKNNNRLTIDFLKNIISSQKSNDEFVLSVRISGLQIGLVDAASEGKEMDDKTGGVGLARKIGFDLALKIFDYSNPFKKILISLDADCTVDKNYLTSIVNAFNGNDLSAGVINYQHNIKTAGANTPAIVCYEIFLRYYVLGLTYTNSPFALNTIGSTIACDHIAYIKTGGMNKRKAAEDFYFIQKLAKLYPVHTLYSTTVYPSARNSVRTPFGTAKRIDSFSENMNKYYLLYDPKSFEVLKKWLDLFNSGLSVNPDELMRQAEKINIHLAEYLREKDFHSQWKSILENCKSESQLSYQKNNWFDAFKTLKLIHHLRDHSFSQINMFVAVNNLFRMFGEPAIQFDQETVNTRLNIQSEFLLKLRELQQKQTRLKITTLDNLKAAG